MMNSLCIWLKEDVRTTSKHHISIFQQHVLAIFLKIKAQKSPIPAHIYFNKEFWAKIGLKPGLFFFTDKNRKHFPLNVLSSANIWTLNIQVF